MAPRLAGILIVLHLSVHIFSSDEPDGIQAQVRLIRLLPWGLPFQRERQKTPKQANRIITVCKNTCMKYTIPRLPL